MTEDDGWTKLDPRSIAVTALFAAGIAVTAAIPTGLGIARAASPALAVARVFPGVALAVVVSGGIGYLRWIRTAYRITAGRVELTSGVLFRTRRSLARERVRSVDITADPLTRLLGLAVVRIGTGERRSSGASSVVLRSVTRKTAEDLRERLLDRGIEQRDDHRALAELDPAWIRYAPLSFLSPLLAAGVCGAVLNVSGWFGQRRAVITWALHLFDDLPLWVSIAILVGIALLVGALGSLALFVEMWWRYRLEREPGGTLRVRRGLFTTRSISLEERRLRGVELVEPLGARLLGAGRVDAIATGMAAQAKEDKTNNKTLLPVAPRDVAHRVAAEVLAARGPLDPSVRLAQHPVTAKIRRIRRALAAVLAIELPLALLGALLMDVLLYLALFGAVVLVPVALLLARDAYRSLGHARTPHYLLTRAGTIRRSTVALDREGIIGWTVKQSIFQRRANLLTLTATTAAGSGGYSVRDVDAQAGLRFAHSITPTLWAPFLDADGATSPARADAPGVSPASSPPG